MARKHGRELVKLQSTESSHFYTTDKNKKTTPGKLEFNLYDPVIRKHVAYKEVKLK